MFFSFLLLKCVLQLVYTNNSRYQRTARTSNLPVILFFLHKHHHCQKFWKPKASLSSQSFYHTENPKSVNNLLPSSSLHIIRWVEYEDEEISRWRKFEKWFEGDIISTVHFNGFAVIIRFEHDTSDHSVDFGIYPWGQYWWCESIRHWKNCFIAKMLNKTDTDIICMCIPS